MDSVRRLWRGELPLATTYWVFGVLLGGVGSCLGWAVIARRLTPLFLAGRGYGLLVLYTFVLGASLYGLFISVATWRSANRYTGPRRWQVLAKAGVALGLLLTAVLVRLALRSDGLTPGTLRDRAEMLNRSLPTLVDSITELRRVSAQDRTLTYHLRIVGKAADQIDMPALSARVKTHACTQEDIRELVTRGITVTYTYTAIDETRLGQVVVTRQECGI
jgi:hypothetical protein